MKKVFWKCGVVIAAIVVVITTISLNSSSKNDALLDLTLQNIEALAISELTPDGWTCFNKYYDDTTSDLFVVIIRCNDCYTTTATSCSNSGHCFHHD